tara:strand:+ start:941 stop:1138 length:198 start_codon:yes stop_codon:yes gene_type:complete
MAKTVFDVLSEKIKEDIDSTTKFLSSGGAKDFSQYKETTGVIRGLNTCLRHIEDLSRNYLDDDND